MIGRAVVTTPRPQGDLGPDQKSACRKSQNNVLAYWANLIDRPVSDNCPCIRLLHGVVRMIGDWSPAFQNDRTT
jgi:hypothetical protein